MYNLLQKNPWHRIGTLLCYLFLSLSLPAATVTWTGGNGNWNVAANWDTGYVPGMYDDVRILSGNVSLTSYTALFQSLHLAGGSLTIDPSGSILIITDISSISVIINVGNLYNNGSIIVFNTATTGFSRGILNAGNFVNNGTIEIVLSPFQGIFSSNSFTNTGDIYISNTGNTGIAALGSFTNSPTGTIEIEEVSTGLYVSSGAIFTNQGAIDIADISTAILIVGSQYINSIGSNLSISDFGNFGLNTLQNSIFKNWGQVTIDDPDKTAFAVGESLAINYQTGVVDIIDSGGDYGLEVSTDGEYRNFGKTYIRSPQNNAIKVLGQFNNKPKGFLLANGRISTYSGSSVLNQGHIEQNYRSTNSIYGGTFTNRGAIGDPDEAFASNFNNQSVRVRPLHGTVQVGLPYPNALDVGTFNYLTVLGWYTNPNGSISAGTYNPYINTFIPNSNAAGKKKLYVTIRINSGMQSYIYEVPVPGGVQSLKGGGSSAGQASTSLAETELHIFPNPSSGIIHLQSSSSLARDAQLSLMNELGQLVWLESLPTDSQSLRSIELPASLPAGVYWLNIRCQGVTLHAEQLILKP